jgi:septal ring factor EnvC (AmiA/AmiB activator)
MNATQLGYSKFQVISFFEELVPKSLARKVDFHDKQIDWNREVLSKKFDELEALKIKKSAPVDEMETLEKEIETLKKRIIGHQQSISKLEQESVVRLQDLKENWDGEHLVQAGNFRECIYFLMPYGAHVEFDYEDGKDKVKITFLGQNLKPALIEESELSSIPKPITYSIGQSTGGKIAV